MLRFVIYIGLFIVISIFCLLVTNTGILVSQSVEDSYGLQIEGRTLVCDYFFGIKIGEKTFEYSENEGNGKNKCPFFIKHD